MNGNTHPRRLSERPRCCVRSFISGATSILIPLFPFLFLLNFKFRPVFRLGGTVNRATPAWSKGEGWKTNDLAFAATADAIEQGVEQGGWQYPFE